MEGGGEKQQQQEQQTRSTLATDLFGPKVDPSASVFASIFPPPKSNSAFEKKSVKQWVPPAQEKKGEGSSTYKEGNSNYQDTKLYQFQYNSSLYYGGQEVYTPPQPTQTPSHFAPYKKDGEEDDGQASRGNWWQGSLYY